jgi:hypothetical protein
MSRNKLEQDSQYQTVGPKKNENFQNSGNSGNSGIH